MTFLYLQLSKEEGDIKFNHKSNQLSYFTMGTVKKASDQLEGFKKEHPVCITLRLLKHNLGLLSQNFRQSLAMKFDAPAPFEKRCYEICFPLLFFSVAVTVSAAGPRQGCAEDLHAILVQSLGGECCFELQTILIPSHELHNPRDLIENSL